MALECDAGSTSRAAANRSFSHALAFLADAPPLE
jgi:hypothetical protein